MGWPVDLAGVCPKDEMVRGFGDTFLIER